MYNIESNDLLIILTNNSYGRGGLTLKVTSILHFSTSSKHSATFLQAATVTTCFVRLIIVLNLHHSYSAIGTHSFIIFVQNLAIVKRKVFFGCFVANIQLEFWLLAKLKWMLLLLRILREGRGWGFTFTWVHDRKGLQHVVHAMEGRTGEIALPFNLQICNLPPPQSLQIMIPPTPT